MSLLAPPSVYADVFRISVDRYHAMIGAGILTADDRVELIEGVLVSKMPKKPAHRICDERLGRILRNAVTGGWSFQPQEPITLSDSEPEPDGAVIRGVAEDYPASHPTPDDIAMVIEVSDTTLAQDRSSKLRTYARANIPVYWIVNLVDRVIEVYSEPDAFAAEATYRLKRFFDAAASVPIVIEGREVAQAPVASILP